MKIGISILTNGNRRSYLKRCLDSLIENCYYRPLVIGIYNNGSTDDTTEWCRHLSDSYGIEYRIDGSVEDRGCAYGTNRSIEMVGDCKYQIHLESDFEHLTEKETGVDKMWLHRAIEKMELGGCDYLYLRRMRNHEECFVHWWDIWMPKITDCTDETLRCPDFWWSNNPSLFRKSAMFDRGVLPLDESKDGPKGTEGWSQPELLTARPSNTWIHRWGMFIHEREKDEIFENNGCNKDCKYGFWMKEGAPWCRFCDHTKNFSDLPNHRKRILCAAAM